ncbi:MAG: metallophosphoesterase, partial [Ferruginibacter sp.]
FVKYAYSLTILQANGRILNARQLDFEEFGNLRVKLRFVIASDGHYGLKDTAYEEYFETVVKRINEEHDRNPFKFCMINGDIIHDDPKHFPAAKIALDKLKPRYYVSQGNHDHVTAEEWKSTWGMPVNLDFAIGKDAFIIATTSNEKGTYLCPDTDWIETQLDKHQHRQHVFIFLHINPGKQTKNAVDCPALFEIFSKHKNIRAVFNGHDHDEDGVKIKNDIPFIFDAHFGGNWGTAYRGFRIVELREDGSLLTYIMNPSEKINETVI